MCKHPGAKKLVELKERLCVGAPMFFSLHLSTLEALGSHLAKKDGLVLQALMTQNSSETDIIENPTP